MRSFRVFDRRSDYLSVQHFLVHLSRRHAKACVGCGISFEEIVGHGYSPLTPIEFNQFCSLGGLAGKPWCYVDVAHERIPEDNYKRRILSIQNRAELD